MKKVLITGSTGMVGSHLIDFLLENTDWYIYGLYRWNSKLDNIEHLISRINAKDRLELLTGDLTDLSSMIKVIDITRPDYVFHLGAQSYPQTSFESAIDTYNSNIIGTSNLLEALKLWISSQLFDGTYPIIHVCSSSEVYGKVSKDKLPINEECTFHPASPYAISKVGTDLISRYYAEAFGMNILTTRMFTHTGPRRGDIFAESSFAKQIALIEKGLQEPKIFVGNLNSLRTYADVRDAVRAYYLLVTVDPIKGECYNIGGNHTCTVEEMLNYLLNLSSVKDIEIVVDKNRLRPIDANLQVPDVSKFKKHTGWEPIYTFDQTMSDLLNYWREKIEFGKNFLNR